MYQQQSHYVSAPQQHLYAVAPQQVQTYQPSQYDYSYSTNNLNQAPQQQQQYQPQQQIIQQQNIQHSNGVIDHQQLQQQHMPQQQQPQQQQQQYVDPSSDYYKSGSPSPANYNSMVMATNNVINNIRQYQPPLQQQQQQQQDKMFFMNMYGGGGAGNNNNNGGGDNTPIGYLPFSDEKNLILLSALGEGMYCQAPPQQQQQPQQIHHQQQHQQQQQQQQFYNQPPMTPMSSASSIGGLSIPSSPSIPPQQLAGFNSSPAVVSTPPQGNPFKGAVSAPLAPNVMYNNIPVHSSPAIDPQHKDPGSPFAAITQTGLPPQQPQPIPQAQQVQVQVPQQQPQQPPPPQQAQQSPQPQPQPAATIPTTTAAASNKSSTPTVSSQHCHPSTSLSQYQPSIGKSAISSYILPQDFEETLANLSEKQKSRRRASQNLASRNYRQRKKAYIGEVETRLDGIVSENDRLKKELFEAKKIIDKLMTENSILKNGGKLPEKSDIPGCTGSEDEDEADFEGSLNPSGYQEDELDINVLVDKLEVGMRISTANDDLSSILKTFYKALKSRQDIYVNQIKQIVNPCTQAKLAILDGEISGAVRVPGGLGNENCGLQLRGNIQVDSDPPQKDSSPVLSPVSTPVQDLQPTNWWIAFCQEASINDEQEFRIRQLRQESNYKHKRVTKDRKQLNKEIRDYYHSKVFKKEKSNRSSMVKDSSSSISSSTNNNSNPSSDDNLQNMEQTTSPVSTSYLSLLSELLDQLKENLDHENELLLQTYEKLGFILTPYQEALLITKIYNNIFGEEEYSNVQMLHAIWDTILYSYK